MKYVITFWYFRSHLKFVIKFLSYEESYFVYIRKKIIYILLLLYVIQLYGI